MAADSQFSLINGWKHHHAVSLFPAYRHGLQYHCLSFYIYIYIFELGTMHLTVRETWHRQLLWGPLIEQMEDFTLTSHRSSLCLIVPTFYVIDIYIPRDTNNIWNAHELMIFVVSHFHLWFHSHRRRRWCLSFSSFLFFL